MEIVWEMTYFSSWNVANLWNRTKLSEIDDWNGQDLEWPWSSSINVFLPRTNSFHLIINQRGVSLTWGQPALNSCYNLVRRLVFFDFDMIFFACVPATHK